MKLSSHITIECGGQGSGRHPTGVEHYHGTTLNNALDILKNGFKGKVYVTPDKLEAKSYAYASHQRESDSDPKQLALIVLKDLEEKHNFRPNSQIFRENRNWLVSTKPVSKEAIDRIEVYSGKIGSNKLLQIIKAK